MKKARQIRLFSFALIVLFLATSTLARVVTLIDAGDFTSSNSFHNKTEAPYSSDRQFPFEEKEKEFEDKSESDDRNNTFVSNFFFIGEVIQQTNDVSDFLGLSFFNSTGSVATPQVPLFLSNHTLLI